MPLKTLFVCCCLFMFGLVFVYAQETPLWCEIDSSNIPRQPTPTPTLDTEAVIGGIVDIPQGSRLYLPTRGNILYSADSSRAVIGILNESTFAHELIGLDLVNRRLIFRIPAFQIRQLRPFTNTNEIPDNVWISRIQWIANTYTLAFQTQDFFQNDPEYRAPPDDLHIIEADGQVRTLLTQGTGGIATFSPNGQSVAVTTSEQLILLRTDGSERRDNALEAYRVSRQTMPPVFWENNLNLLIFLPPEPDTLPYDALIESWRVFFENRNPESVASYRGSILRFQVAPSGDYVTYTWQNPDDNLFYASIASTFTGEELYTVETTDLESFDGRWLIDSTRLIWLYIDNQRKYHYIALCDG